MFGVLTPALNSVSAESKQLYHQIYCNLCASLSASGRGVWNRFFLVNDVVTVDWLLTEEENEKNCAFECKNCVKGGVIGRKNRVLPHQTLLAALSTFVCGIKINDDARDTPKLKYKLRALLFRPMMKKAESSLRKFNLLDKLNHYLEHDKRNETQCLSNIDQACEPTEKCYELLTVEIAKKNSTLSQSTLELLGRYLGRCVYLLDAMNDMEKDRATHQYNVLNALSIHLDDHEAKRHIMGKCLEFLKPMRLEITEKLKELPDTLKFKFLQEKWESLFWSIESQLSDLITPLNDSQLLNILSSFSVGSKCFGTINENVGICVNGEKPDFIGTFCRGRT